MDHSPNRNDEPPEPAAERPRAPGAIRGTVALLWLFAALALFPTLLGIVFARFQVTVEETITIGDILAVLPAPLLACLSALLAVKLWSGREWARQATLIMAFIGVAVVFTFPGNPIKSPAILLWAALGTIVLLLTRRSARNWCDPEAPQHSPRIRRAPQPPLRVVAVLLLLWTATGYALALATATFLSMAQNAEDFADPTRTAWIMAGTAAAALGHIVLNIGFARHRDWGRLGTEVLMVAYAVALVAYAVTAPAREGTWEIPLLVALVPLAFLWAVRSEECKEWCGHSGSPAGEGQDGNRRGTNED